MLEILLKRIANGATLQQALDKIEKDYRLSPQGVIELKRRYTQINQEHQWTN